MPSTKNKSKTAPVNKSKFVKAQPSSMSASEVVAAAKAQGITLRDKYVYNVRAKAKVKAVKSAPKTQAVSTVASAPTSVKATSTPPATNTAKKVNKSAFVRSLPTSMTAKEVVAKAKAQGITLSVPLVYIARRKTKPAAAKRSLGRPRKNSAAAVAVSGVESSGVENLLRAAAAEIGLSRAMAILSEQRDAVRAVLGG
jgi:hypothetical protein